MLRSSLPFGIVLALLLAAPDAAYPAPPAPLAKPGLPAKPGLLAQSDAPAPSGSSAQSAPLGFFRAIARDDDADVRVYLLRGASVGARDERGNPALVLAAAERSFRVLRTFLAIPGTDVDVVNPRNETALMFVALHGNVEAAQELLENGSEVNRTGWTPLHYAATGGHLSMVRLLLEHHAYIDAESPNRSTPLIMAARHRHEAVVRELVGAGADPTGVNDADLGAADYAHRAGDVELARWIRAKSDEFNARYRAAGTVRR